MRWHETTGERLASAVPSAPAGDVELQIVRTVPEKIYEAMPKGDFGILESYVRAIRAARRLHLPREPVPLVARDRCDPRREGRAIHRRPTSGSARAAAGEAEQRGRRHARGARRAARGRRRSRARLRLRRSMRRSGRRADPIYVHAKVGDRRRRLAHDRLREPERALALQRHRDERRHPRSRHWPARRVSGSGRSISSCRSRSSIATRSRSSTTLWKPISQEQHAHREAGRPLTHRLVCLPQVSKRSSRLLGPVMGLVVDG